VYTYIWIQNSDNKKTGSRNYGSKIRITKKREAEIETAEMSILRKNQTRNFKIREELNIFNLSNNILKSRSQSKHHVLQMEDR
jgi:hypothetical protein